MPNRSNTGPRLKVSAPVNVFFKPITFEFKSLFKALAKGIGHTAVGKWEELGSDAVDLLAAIGVESKPEELAYLLIKRALISATFELLGDTSAQMLADPGENEEFIWEEIEPFLESFPIEIGVRFLERPLDLPVIEQAKGLLRKWLEGYSLIADKAEAISDRFPTYFIYALNTEWRTNRKSYQPVLDAMNTPFSRAGDREWAWLTYRALLNKRIDEPSFDEAFSLNQIFVAPHAFYIESPPRVTMDQSTDAEHRIKRIAVSLEQELNSWLAANDREDTLRVISGGPGSGKSSFARVFASRVFNKNKLKVLFIPLHLIDPAKDLVDEVGRFVKDEGILVENPLDAESSEPNLLVIFDGLDELASQGKAAVELSRAFIREVEKTVQRRNLVNVTLRVLISGRELVVQENETDFRRTKQILTLLPYFVSDDEREGELSYEYIDHKDILKKDLRNEWWKTYGRLTGKHYAGLPTDLRRIDLDEITAQPLLNYLVALSYNRGEIDFRLDVNLNSIYADLVSAVHQRGYEKHRTFGPIRQMTAEQFSRILEEIGLAAWHGDGRTTSVAEIEQHCKASGVGPLLELFQDGAKAGVTRLLAAFFFRKQGQRSGGDATFEFTHKSFGEYLAAKRIARAVDKVAKDLALRFENLDDGWDERDALRFWAMICGPTAISTYIHGFLYRELQARPSVGINQLYLSRLFGHVLRHGMPMELLPFTSFKVVQNNARNSEEALLVVLNACARATEKVSDVGEVDPVAFGTWFRRIQGQRSGPVSSLAAKCLAYLNLTNCFLDLADFYGADLSFSIMRGIKANYTNFGMANLNGVDMSGGILASAQIFSAQMQKADLSHANLRDAQFSNTEFEGVNLEGARINKEEADKIILRGADLSRSIIEDSDHGSSRRRIKENRKTASHVGGR